MGNSLKQVITKLQPAIDFLRKYMVGIVIVVILSAFGFLVWRIGSLASAEPSDSALEDALAQVKRPKIDATAIKALQALQEQNVDIKALFPTDRNNPFQE